MKRVIMLCLFLIAGITLSSCAGDLNRKQVFTIVQENHAFLQKCIDEGNYDRSLEIRGIQNTYTGGKGSYVKFYCGGTGLGPSTSYYGFYYSPTDAPLAVDVPETETLTSFDDGWGWSEPNGDNSYYTERIMECWYYYEWHF